MKIMLLVSSLNMGGAERVASILSNAWATRGDEVTVVLTYSQVSSTFYELASEVDVIHLSTRVSSQKKSAVHYAKRLLALRALIKQKKPDVIVSFLANVNIAAVIASRQLHIPVVCCERRNPQQTFGVLLEWLCKKTYPYADVLLAQTSACTNLMRKIHPKAKKVAAIANPLSDEIFSFKKNWEKKPRKVLCSLGRLVHEKQMDKLILAFSRLAHSFSDWDLHIYGDGPLRAQLAALANELNVNHRVIFKGAVTNPWEALANKADIFVLCSKSEGFPNALLEAMAVGLPCISLDFPFGAREMSDNGNNAVLVPQDDMQVLETEMMRLMQDENVRIELGAKARKYVQINYSLNRIMSCWDNLLFDLALSHGDGP